MNSTDHRWINGSETLCQREKTFWQQKSPIFGGEGFAHDRKITLTERRHREHDELRYSVRSIFKYFNNQFSGIRILAPDFQQGESWIGQVPTWLDLEAGKQHGVSMIYTSEMYGNDKTLLPVFNSFALESKFSKVASTAGNDVMVYLNDDMFLAREHTISDFWNPLLGLNLRFDPNSWVESQNPSLQDFQLDWNSEWPALRYSNHLLSTSLASTKLIPGQRFGVRRRVYIAHFARPLSRTILKEVESEFPTETHETSTHRFRNEGKETNTLFLHSHYLMERHRETLLQSIMHRTDMNADGALDFEERKVLISQIQQSLESKYLRKTAEAQTAGMQTADLPLQKASSILWPATDGYPFALNSAQDASVEADMKKPNRPTFKLGDKPHLRTPGFDLVEYCFTSDFISPHLNHTKVDVDMLLTLLARDYPYCGDMLLATLIPAAASGLAHVLPAPSHPKYTEMVLNLHKYAYTISESHSEFIMAKSAFALKKGFVRVLSTFRPAVQFCVNDDVEQSEGPAVESMDATLKGILQGYFGGLTKERGRSPVEKLESVEDINGAGLDFWSARGGKGGPGYDVEETKTTGIVL
jgi:hypothetical protein